MAALSTNHLRCTRQGGGGIISATLWHTLLIIGGFKATGRARRVSGHCSHRRRLSVLVAVWHWHTGLGPPTVSSTDAVSGLRIRYFTLQLLLLLLLRLPLQVSLERNYSYYYSGSTHPPISRTRLGLSTLPYRFWSVKNPDVCFIHHHIYRPQQALDDPRDRIRCLCRCATPAARHASD